MPFNESCEAPKEVNSDAISLRKARSFLMPSHRKALFLRAAAADWCCAIVSGCDWWGSEKLADFLASIFMFVV